MKPGAIRWCRRILQKMGVLEWVCIILVGFLLLWQPKATLAFLCFLFLRKEVWSVAIAIFVFTCVFFTSTSGGCRNSHRRQFVQPVVKSYPKKGRTWLPQNRSMRGDKRSGLFNQPYSSRDGLCGSSFFAQKISTMKIDSC